jgi:hypothetical protein
MPAETIVSELMKLLQNALCDAKGGDLSTLEQCAVEFGRRASELAMGEMLTSCEDEPVAVKCECGGCAYIKDNRNRIQVTLAGSHIIRRARYQCRSCGAWIYPRDLRLGIGIGSYSAGVVALSSEVAAGFPFEASEGFLARRFGLDLCYKQVQRIAERTGAVIGQQEFEQASQVVAGSMVIESESRHSTFTISADGVMVHSDGVWTEMKCASFISEEHRRSTIATMSRAEKFGELLYLEAVRRGVHYAERVVFVADGAAWIWNLAAHHFPGCVEIVDWYHATQHLWEVANSWYGQGSKKAKNWIKRNKARLMEDGVSRVISSIRQWKPIDEDAQKVKRENLHYFTTNAARMLYAGFRNSGYNIGSGSVESACKQYGHGRLKQAGMRWKLDGIEAVAHLRSALLNDRTENILEAARIAA